MKGFYVIMAAALLVATPLALWSEDGTDGAQLYKAKCATCHGEKGEGKPAMKMPAINETKMDVEQLVNYLTKGEKGKTIHANPVSGINAQQAKAIAEHVSTLKK